MKVLKNYKDLDDDISAAVLHLYDFGGSITFDMVSEVFDSKNEMKGLIGAIENQLVDYGDNRIWVKPSLMFRFMEVFA